MAVVHTVSLFFCVIAVTTFGARNIQLGKELVTLYNGSTVLVGLGFVVEVSRSHSDAPHFVGLLLTSDRPVAETCT
jgi:hypothetical protein